METCLRCQRKYKRSTIGFNLIVPLTSTEPFYKTQIPNALCKKCYKEFREFWVKKG